MFKRTPKRRGNAMIYVMIVLPAIFAVISLAVDLGRVQVIKSELQRAADATARGYLNIYVEYGDAIAQQYAPYIPQLNPVDNNNTTPTTTITRGYWNSQTKVFTAGTGTPFAIRCVMSRKAAQNKAVPLMWGRLIGFNSADVEVEAIGMLTTAASVTQSVNAQSDPWLAGMPAGSTASYNDTAGDATKAYNDTARKQSTQQLSIPVVPGSFITFESIVGQVRHGPTLQDYEPDGEPHIYSHGADSPGGPTPAAENGIGDVKMPINAFMGVFLNDSRPNTTAAPTEVRDYTTATSRDQTMYSDLQLKQPFFIGDGETSGGTRQQFRVPEGATRLFVGIMDGHEWSNNQGSFSVTTRVKESIKLVR